MNKYTRTPQPQEDFRPTHDVPHQTDGLTIAELDVMTRVEHGSNGNGKRRPEAERASRFRLISAAEMVTLPPVKWLVRGEIPEGGFCVLYGPSGIGKSTVALDLALRVAKDRRVVYIAGEGEGGYPARLLAWQLHFREGHGHLDFLTQAVNLLEEQDVADLLGVLDGVGPALIVIDTLARCMQGGDENSAKDMGRVVAAVDTIRSQTGAAVLLIHHTGKNGASERGSSALRGAADTMLELSESDGVLTLSVSKSKDAAPNKPRFLRLVTVETGRRRDDGEPETACVALPTEQVYTAGQLTRTGRRVLEALALEIFAETGARKADLVAYLAPIPERTLFNALSKLKEDGYISQSAKGDPYRVTELGRLALGGKVPGSGGLQPTAMHCNRS